MPTSTLGKPHLVTRVFLITFGSLPKYAFLMAYINYNDDEHYNIEDYMCLTI